MASEKCVICPLIIPSCPACDEGQTCIIVAQSCNVCAYTSCLDNAQVSSGHYTIGSTGIPGPISTINPIDSSVISISHGSTTSSATSASTTSSGSTTSASSSSSATQGSTGSSAAATTQTGGSTSTTASQSSVLSSVVSSATSSPTTGAAPTLGVQAMETQGLALVLMAFWVGMGLFGGRRAWRL